MKSKDVSIDEISIGKRHRKDLGDLQGLAESIQTEGLLHPIGITPDKRLVFGQRRLLAIRDILKAKIIEARVVKVSSIAAGEYAENEIRKDFTMSERVAIGEALEAEMGNRQGTRTDLELSDDGHKVKQGRTTDIIAHKVGFGSGREYERAKTIMHDGSRDLQQAVDAGKIPVSSAAKLTALPKSEQSRIAKSENPAAEARKAVAPKKPKATFPVFEHFLDQLSKIAFALGKIEEDYSSIAKFMEHKDWDKSRTPQAVGFVKAIAGTITSFQKEMERCQRK